MGQKATSFLSVAFYLLFGLLFSSLVLLLVVKSGAPILALLTVTAVLVLMALFYQFLGKHEDFLKKCYPVLLAGFLICSGIIQLASANMLRFQPVFDLGAIYHGAIILFLYLKVGESEMLWKQIGLIVLLGAAAVLGMLIKFTVVIMVIAIVIDSLFHRSLKQTGMLAGISTAVICAGFFRFEAMIYPAHLDRDAAKEYNTPCLHWVMMGLKGDGGCNGEDYAFTRSFLLQIHVRYQLSQ